MYGDSNARYEGNPQGTEHRDVVIARLVESFVTDVGEEGMEEGVEEGGKGIRAVGRVYAQITA